MDRRSFLSAGIAGAAALTTGACSRGRSVEPAPEYPAVIATGNEEGVYAQYGAGIAKLVTETTGVTLTPVITGGSVANLEMLRRRRADVAFSLADSAADAYRGRAEFSEKGQTSMWALARTHDNYLHVVVPLDSDIETFTDLRGKRVNLGMKNSGTFIVARRLLNAAWIDYRRDLKPFFADLHDSTELLKADKIDALIWSGGLPTDALTKLQASEGFKLIDIGQWAKKLVAQRISSYVVTSVPPSAYGTTNAVSTLSIPNFLVARFGLPDPWAWWIVNTLFRKQSQLVSYHPEAASLDPRSAIATMPIPLHPAAERWYRAHHT
jgi:TRAP transporter TAXI family solute receptor